MWRRSGMSGTPVGLELDEALHSAVLYGAADPAFATDLLVAIEVGALAGFAKLRPPSDPD